MLKKTWGLCIHSFKPYPFIISHLAAPIESSKQHPFFMLKIIVLLFFSVLLNAVSATEITYKTVDNAMIHANFQQRGNHAVLLAHGAIFNKESWGEFEQRLLKENFSVLAIDFRGYNQSTQGDSPQARHEDILAGVRFLRNQKSIQQVTVLGASMGGAAAAKANIKSRSKGMDQLILLSPAKISKPEQLNGRLLLIASEKEYVAANITSAFDKASEPKKLLLLKGRAHAQHIFKTSEKETLTQGIIDFLKEM